jgi:biopolymer transport protein ExbD/biopolymer transport protein TolR
MRRLSRFDDAGRVQAAINITPLVDVVLVLLIIFMVMAPQMNKGPDVDLPETARPAQQGDEGSQIMVSIDGAGQLFINELPFESAQFGDGLRAAAAARPESKIVIRGDATLDFRQVRETMLAVEQAGFRGVGLIAQRAGADAQGE